MGSIVSAIAHPKEISQSGKPPNAAVWTCSRCTLPNNTLSSYCSACGYVRAVDPFPSPASNGSAGWVCSFCTLKNSAANSVCEACRKSVNGTFSVGDSGHSKPPSPARHNGAIVKAVHRQNGVSYSRPPRPANSRPSTSAGDIETRLLGRVDRQQSALTGEINWEVELGAALEKYRNVVNFVRSTREPFTDPEFPPTDLSLRGAFQQRDESAARHSYTGKIVWLRPYQINAYDGGGVRSFLPSVVQFRSWTLMDDPRPSDIGQGALGNCWLLSALAVLAERRDLLERIFIRDFSLLGGSPSASAKVDFRSCAAEGVYLLRLCVNGLWKAVVVDDLLPCDVSGRLIYSKAKRHQLWVPLIEKALAKLHGSYGALVAGRCVEALSTLTGYPCEPISLESKFGKLTEEEKDVIWARLLSCRERGYLLGASCGAGRSEVNEATFVQVGLLSRHAYSVLDIQEVPANESAQTPQPYRLVRLRNPWGDERRDWRGAWCADSADWQQVPAAFADVLKAAARETSSFWISYPDLLTYFDSVDCCKVGDWFEMRLTMPSTAVSMRKLKVAILTVFEAGSVEFGVFQESLRGARQVKSRSDICCSIYRGNASETRRIGECVASSGRESSAFVRGDAVVLRPGEYTIVTKSLVNWSLDQDDSIDDSLTLTIHSEKRVLVEEREVDRGLLADSVYELVKRYGEVVNVQLTGCMLHELSGSKWAGSIVVASNLSPNAALHVELQMQDSMNLVSSRKSLHTFDIVPPMCSQVLMVASQLEPSSGWRLSRTLKTLLSHSNMSLKPDWRLTDAERNLLGPIERFLEDPAHDPAVIDAPVEHLHAPRPLI